MKCVYIYINIFILIYIKGFFFYKNVKKCYVPYGETWAFESMMRAVFVAHELQFGLSRRLLL